MSNENISYVGLSDVGLRRENNEDAFVVTNIWNENTVLAVVIDGVGGYEGGERAAALAQEKIVEYLENYPNGERLSLLKRAVVYANNAIYDERAKVSQYSRMSCVLTAVIVDYACRTIYMAHVGDTRLYSYTDGVFAKLSHDHSFVGYREELGDLTEIEAMNHPERNIISRDVGSKQLQNSDLNYIEVATFALAPHTTLLLCSDGLCDMITSVKMKEILGSTLSLQQKCEALVAAANDAGGRDNITVVLVETFYDENEIHQEEVSTDAGNVPIEEPSDIEHCIVEEAENEEKKKFVNKYRKWKLIAIVSWIIFIVIIVAMLVMKGYYIKTNPDLIITDTVAPLDTLPCDTIKCNMVDTILQNAVQQDSVPNVIE